MTYAKVQSETYLLVAELTLVVSPRKQYNDKFERKCQLVQLMTINYGNVKISYDQ